MKASILRAGRAGVGGQQADGAVPLSPSPGIGAQQAGAQPFGCLVGHLDAILEDGDGEEGAGVAGEPHAEVAVDLRGEGRGGTGSIVK